MKQADPCKGKWCLDSKDFTVWVDTSSLATRVTIEFYGSIVNDACCLRPLSDIQHINLTELDAVIRRVNLAIPWEVKTMHLKTDSLYVYKWLTDTLTHKLWVKC